MDHRGAVWIACRVVKNRSLNKNDFPLYRSPFIFYIYLSQRIRQWR